MSRAVRFAVGAAAMAVEDSGLEPASSTRRGSACAWERESRRWMSANWSVRSCEAWTPTAAFDMGRFAQARAESIFPLWLLQHLAQHGGGPHLDPPPRDGAE